MKKTLFNEVFKHYMIVHKDRNKAAMLTKTFVQEIYYQDAMWKKKAKEGYNYDMYLTI